LYIVRFSFNLYNRFTMEILHCPDSAWSFYYNNNNGDKNERERLTDLKNTESWFGCEAEIFCLLITCNINLFHHLGSYKSLSPLARVFYLGPCTW
jgi:hypothetical protein